MRGRQRAQVLIDMVVIGQWYGTHTVRFIPMLTSLFRADLFAIHIQVAQKPKKQPTVKFRDVDRDIIAAVSRSTTTSNALSTSDNEEHRVDNSSTNADDSDSDSNLSSDSDSEDRTQPTQRPTRPPK